MLTLLEVFWKARETFYFCWHVRRESVDPIAGQLLQQTSGSSCRFLPSSGYLCTMLSPASYIVESIGLFGTNNMPPHE